MSTLPVLLTMALMIGAPVPRAVVTAKDLDGRTWTPLNPSAGDVHLVIFVSSECPISNRYAPEIDRMAADYHGRHVQTFIVYVDPGARTADIRASFRDFHPTSLAHPIVDDRLALTAAAGATVTPEAVVYTSAGRQYRGRIDDLNLAVGQSQRAAQHRDLREALDAVLAGHAVARTETNAVGCVIERRPS